MTSPHSNTHISGVSRTESSDLYDTLTLLLVNAGFSLLLLVND